MSWTPEKIKQLKKLWAKGKSTVEIGRELGISKNAVVGKVHRLELDARPSPIKKAAAPAPKPQKAKPSNNKGYMTLLDLKLNSCRWPIGEPKDADFHFCGKDTVTGKPYCAEHCKVAYTSLKELASQNKNDPKKAVADEIIEDAEFEEIEENPAQKGTKVKSSKAKSEGETVASLKVSTKKEEASKSAKPAKDSSALKGKASKSTVSTGTKSKTKVDAVNKTKTIDKNSKTAASKSEQTKETKKIAQPSIAKKTADKLKTAQKPAKTPSKKAKETPTKPTTKTAKTSEKSAPVASILKRVVNAAKSKRK